MLMSIKEWHQRYSLPRWCFATFIFSLIALATAWWAWGVAGVSDPNGKATLSVTTVGGIGGSIFLVVRYRAQKLAEDQFAADNKERSRKHVSESLESAVDMLTSDTSLKKITGARKLIELADETDDPTYRQRAVTALCAFLRLSEDEDRRVEQIIIETLEERLRKVRSDKPSWSMCSLDLRQAVLTQPVNLADCEFRGEADWREVTFKAETFFNRTTFHATTTFVDATFEDVVEFQECRFEEGVMADFSGAHFQNKAIFQEANFGGEVRFGEVIHASDDGSQSSAGSDEDSRPSTAFESNSGGEGDGFSFAEYSTFEKLANFSGAEFHGLALFGGRSLNGTQNLETHFRGDTDFSGSIFHEDANFKDAHFIQGATFGGGHDSNGRTRSSRGRGLDSLDGTKLRGAQFLKAATFEGAHFHPDDHGKLATFGGVAAEGCIDFSDATFDDELESAEGVMRGDISFRGARMNVPPSFDGAEITCDKHRSRRSTREWPEGVTLSIGEFSGLPARARCPASECRPVYPQDDTL